MLVEPLADEEVNVPGVMAILVAPVAVQLSVLLAPEFMLVGFAVKEVIAGLEPLPDEPLDEVDAPQPASPAQANSIRTSEQRASPEALNFGEMRLFPRNEFVESMRKPQQSQSIAYAVAAVALRGPSPLDGLGRFVHQVPCVIRRSTYERVQEGIEMRQESAGESRSWNLERLVTERVKQNAGQVTLAEVR
jgi:hypothetical protein